MAQQPQIQWNEFEGYYSCRADQLVMRRPTLWDSLFTTAAYAQEMEASETSQEAELKPTPSIRIPPKYPNFCTVFASPKEYIVVKYDVLKNGLTDKIRIDYASNICFIGAAVEAVCQWKYQESEINHRDILTQFTFEIGD